ncbi:MAG: FGGY-family carbohydrate kinase [Acidimicrobiales bacterium]
MTDHGNAVWLGVDIGTQGVRAVAIDDDGGVRGVGQRPLDSVRHGGRHEQDPESWWTAGSAAIAEATASLGGRRVRALSVAATSGTIVVVDRHLRPLTPGIMYDDLRAADLLPVAQRSGEEVWARSGYRMQPSWALLKIVWLHRQGLLPAGATVLHQGDFVLSRLAGRPLPTDTSTALKAGVDLVAADWSPSVLARLGVPAETLPTVVLPGAVLAEVAPSVDSALRLGSGCVLVSGMTDGCSAQIAAGAVEEGQWNTAMGTTMVVKGVSADLIADDAGAVYSHRGPFGYGWYAGGASSSGARAFQHWLPGDSLDAVARSAALRRDPPLVYPLVGAGERFPFVNRDATAMFEPGFEAAGAAERFAGIAHGIAYLERLAYERLSGLGFRIDDPITFTGGGTRTAWWNQLRSDVLGRSVRLRSNTEGATGMAVLAAAAVGRSDPPSRRLPVAASRLLDAGSTIEPRPDQAERHEHAYRRFLSMLERAGYLDPGGRP